MDFHESMNLIRIVLGDNYTVLDTFDVMHNTYTIRIERKYTNWHIKMEFTSGDILRMGTNFIGAVCRSVVSEYSEFITRGVPE